MNERINTAQVEESIAAMVEDVRGQARRGELDTRVAQFQIDAISAFHRAFCKGINDGASHVDMRNARMSVLATFLEEFVRGVAAEFGDTLEYTCQSAFRQLFHHVSDALTTRDDSEVGNIAIRAERGH
ncbi:hypothetical protein PUR29_32830 [Methylobacterium ajmalii]|uniref:Uncharacterized protein n=1 Tax=Methylobacterium ajmalii TaxID=2738439 RepID=A0ABV0A328_9HYPH